MPAAAWEATACIVIPWFIPRYEAGTPWQAMAWWVHDHLPYSDIAFFPTYAAFNLPLVREAGAAHRELRPAQGMPHQARHGEPRRRPFLGVPRLSRAQAALTPHRAAA